MSEDGVGMEAYFVIILLLEVVEFDGNRQHGCTAFIQSVEVVNNLFQSAIQDYAFSLRGNNSLLYTHVEETSSY